MPIPKKSKSKELSKFREEPLLLDDPWASPLEWLEYEDLPRFEVVRKETRMDPWSRPSFASENDALTERRRRKLQHLSINLEDECCDGHSESVA